MNADELWRAALNHHNSRNYHEAHELFEDLWLEQGNRADKDVAQALAQADALAVHLETGNLRAAQRLMRQLPQLAAAIPDRWQDVGLQSLREWIAEVAATIPPHGDIPDVERREPPSIIERGG